jgi:hypothetical protein
MRPSRSTTRLAVPAFPDPYEEGLTITPRLAETVDGDRADPAFRDAVETAVLELPENGSRQLAAA